MTEPGLLKLADAIMDVVLSASRPAQTDRRKIREEIISSVREDGRATIRGHADLLWPKSSTFKMAAGQRVHVLFQGHRPLLILGHGWKRAQFAAYTGLAIIEELLLVETDGVRTLHFRNDQQVTDLKLTLSQALLANVSAIRWGVQDNTFALRVDSGTTVLVPIPNPQTAWTDRGGGTATQGGGGGADNRQVGFRTITGPSAALPLPTVTFVAPSAPSQPLGVSATPSAGTVTVALASGAGSADSISTSAEVVAALASDPVARTMLEVYLPLNADGSGSTGAGIVRAETVPVTGDPGTNLYTGYATQNEIGNTGPTFYIYRLNRNPGDALGATPATATLVKTVSLPRFELPARMRNEYLYDVTSRYLILAQPRHFPDLAPVVDWELTVDATGELDIVAMASVFAKLGRGVESVFSGNTFTRYHTYLLVIRPSTRSILYELPETEAVKAAGYETGDGFAGSVNPGAQGRILRWDLRHGGQTHVVAAWARTKGTHRIHLQSTPIGGSFAPNVYPLTRHELLGFRYGSLIREEWILQSTTPPSDPPYEGVLADHTTFSSITTAGVVYPPPVAPSTTPQGSRMEDQDFGDPPILTAHWRVDSYLEKSITSVTLLAGSNAYHAASGAGSAYLATWAAAVPPYVGTGRLPTSTTERQLTVYRDGSVRVVQPWGPTVADAFLNSPLVRPSTPKRFVWTTRAVTSTVQAATSSQGGGAGSNNRRLTFTTKPAPSSAPLAAIDLVEPTGPSQSLFVVGDASDRSVTIFLGSDGSGAATTTANDVVAAVAADPVARTILEVSLPPNLDALPNTGTGIVQGETVSLTATQSTVVATTRDLKVSDVDGVTTALASVPDSQWIATQARIAGLFYFAPDLAYAISEPVAGGPFGGFGSRTEEREHLIEWPPTEARAPEFLGTTPFSQDAVRSGRDGLATRAQAVIDGTIDKAYHAIEDGT